MVLTETIDMLAIHPSQENTATSLAANVVWIDLLEPTAEERIRVESQYALKLPSRHN